MPAHVDHTELRICHLYKTPRIWLQDEGTGKILLKQLLQANSYHLRTRLAQSGYFVLPTTPEWCFLVDTWAFIGTNPEALGSACP